MRDVRSLLFALYLLAAPCMADIVIPPGFELQVLDTTQGRIAKPKGWYYVHRADKFSLHWVLSKEDTTLGALDAIVVTTFGAPASEWEQARQIADRMNEFELLGTDFWKK